MDALCVGPIVAQASAAFDSYWNHPRSIPITLFYESRDSTRALAKLRARWGSGKHSLSERGYLIDLEAKAYEHRLRSDALPIVWGRAWALYDDPGKSDVESERPGGSMLESMAPLVGDTREELLILLPTSCREKRAWPSSPG